MQKEGTLTDISRQLSDFNRIANQTFINMSIDWAKEYKANPVNFINCLKKFKSLQSAATYMVHSYRYEKILNECKKSGKDFTEYAKKHFPENPETFANLFLILYSIINESL